jgi:glycosyltransferase involved in cell wall biosynthesis
MDWSPPGACPQCTEAKKKVPNRRWFLADPSLINSAGHCARYLQSVAGALAEAGIENYILGNIGTKDDPAGLLRVRPIFRLTCDDMHVPRADFAVERQSGGQWARHSTSIIEGLRAIDEEFLIRDTDVLLFNTVRQWSLPGIVEWLETRPISNCPNIAIVLHYSPHRTRGQWNATTAEYEKALGQIAGSKRKSCIALFADSEELAAEYTQLSGLSCGVVVVPHVGDLEKSPDRKNEITVVAAGPAREDKGFDLLPGVIRALEQSPRNGVLVAQGFSYRHRPRLARTITALRRGGATVLPDELSIPDFRNLIASADLVVLPYSSEDYHSQTSGVFAEALGAGIPVVVPKDTWMARQIAEYGGGVVFDPNEGRGLEAACIVAMSELDLLQCEAASARDRWLQKHGPNQFVNIIQSSLPARPNLADGIVPATRRTAA